MSVTVREAMQVGGLTRCRIVAGGTGLDRKIQYITVMEVPDVIQWLKGNELLLTSLYSIKDNEQAIQDLVHQLNEVNCSALAIKTHRFVENIPQSIIDEGNRLQLPIIEIDDEISYLDIMTPLISTIMGKSEFEQKNFEVLLQWVTELAMGGNGLPSIIRAVQQMTVNMITVESEIPFIDGIVQNQDITPLNRAQKKELKAAKRTIRMERILNQHVMACLVTPLLLNHELYGYITCWQTEQKFLEHDFSMLDRITPLLALEFLKAKTKADVEQNFKDDFLFDILSGQIDDREEVIAKGKVFGWNLKQAYQVLAIVFVPKTSEDGNLGNEAVTIQELKKKVLRKVTDIFRYNGQESIIGFRKDHIVVLFPYISINTRRRVSQHNNPQKEQIVNMAEALHNQLTQEFNEFIFTMGIGRFYQGLEGLQQGYQEAVKAIRLGRTFRSTEGCLHFEDLGIYRILSQLPDRKELEDIFAETVGKLVEYDQKNNARLMETLFEYFKNNCGLTETAEKLYVHVNTLKYRLQKIEQVSGCSIHNAEERLMLHIGLKIYHILRTDGSDNAKTL